MEIKRGAAVLAATGVLALGGVGAAAVANAGAHDNQGSQGQDCPRGYRSMSVPVNGYTLWTCAKTGGSQPGPTTTVTVTQPGSTVTVTESAPRTTVTLTATVTKTVPVTITCAGTPQVCR